MLFLGGNTVATTTIRPKGLLKPRATSRERRAWYLYDFGNSAYAAVVLLAVYAAYFQGKVVGGAEGSRLWGWAVGIAMLIVAIISPVLGAIADFSASKKRFLFAFTAITVVFTGSLFFVQPGNIILGMLLFILAEVGYRGAQVFYDALLTEIAAPDEIARVSGIGWAIGSIGGIVCLLIVFPLIMFTEGLFMTRFAMVITAVFFALFSVPIFRDLKERAEALPLPPGETYLTVGFRKIAQTLREARQYKAFIRFVIAFIIYHDGVMMVMNFASIIGAVLFGLAQQQLVIFVIIVQVTNVLGAYFFGMLAHRYNIKRALVFSIVMMIGAIVWLLLAQSATMFFVVGAVAGFAMAGIQSLSRTMVGVLGPEGRSAEFYGFFAVAGRTSSFIGPTAYGIIAYRAALWFEAQGFATLAAEQSGQRVAIVSIGAFLALGLLILLAVNLKKAQAALEAEG
ncbi:MAG: Vacuole effluxer Atg22 like protein [Chloroflexi bacterium ADurb.Bin360]|nr:MAG: Vacuole effluxer Atg22 like protein [Chloroflexi bacterium ADurb.Bin360]